jgi:hypothetical protein
MEVVMPRPAGNSRYTPPKSFEDRGIGRQSALRNKVMGLGSANLGDSPTARRAQNETFDRMERISAFDRDVAPGVSSRTGRGVGTGGRIVSGQGSTTTPVRIRPRPTNPSRLPVSTRPRPGTALEPYRGGVPAVPNRMPVPVGGGGTGRIPATMGPRRSPLALPSGPTGTPVSVRRRPPMGPDASGGDLPGRADAPTNPRSSGGGMGGKGLRNMSSRTKLMMGAGALVLGAAAYSGRRGDGTSSGRSGMTRY